MPVYHGQMGVPTAGTAVQMLGQPGKTFAFCPHPDNTGVIYLGGSTNVSSATGYAIPSGTQIILQVENNISEVWINATANGDKVCWIRLD